MFPEEFKPIDDLELRLRTRANVSIHRCLVEFAPCGDQGTFAPDRAYAAKPLVMLDKQALFPEVAMLALFRRAGWDGVWVDSPHHKYFEKMPSLSKGVSLTPYLNQLLARVVECNAQSRAGCWDLILWSNRTVVLVAVKAAAADVGLRETQARWLDAALRAGLSPGQFLIALWDYKKLVVAKRRRAAPG
jgi:hypothetical protein